MTILFEFADATVVGVREGEPRIAGSTSADRSIGDEPGGIAGEAIASAETVTRCGGDAGPDDGRGVPPDLHDEIFEMGAKGDASKGTGFGLGFVRALTES